MEINLRRGRHAREMTQEELADRAAPCGMSISACFPFSSRSVDQASPASNGRATHELQSFTPD
jgi:hypothetical protein